MPQDDLENKILGLEIRFAERWDAHDKNSEYHWSNISSQLEEIKDNMKEVVSRRECGEAMGGLRVHISWLWGLASAAAIGVFSFFMQFFLGGGHK